MNTQILYNIAARTLEYLAQTNLIKNLNGINGALQNQINSPTPENLSQIGSAVTNFRNQLESVPGTFFSRTWMPAIEELGFANLIGSSLSSQVEAALNKNQLTITEAQKELQPIIKRLTQLQETFTAIKANLEKLKLVGETLSPGQAELLIVIPRDLFDNELKEFWRETKTIDQILQTIQELCAPKSAGIRLKQLSTSDPMLILGVPIAVVFCILKIVEKILDVYAKTLDIRQMKQDAVAKQMSANLIETMQAEATAIVKDGLTQIMTDLRTEFLSTEREGRRETEIANAMERDLERLATRIDHGLRIEGDVKPIPEKKGEEQTPQIVETRKQISEITRITEKIRYFEMSGEPILQLRAPQEEDKEKG